MAIDHIVTKAAADLHSQRPEDSQRETTADAGCRRTEDSQKGKTACVERQANAQEAASTKQGRLMWLEVGPPGLRHEALQVDGHASVNEVGGEEMPDTSWCIRAYTHAYQQATSAIAGSVGPSRQVIDIELNAAERPDAAEGGANVREHAREQSAPAGEPARGQIFVDQLAGLANSLEEAMQISVDQPEGLANSLEEAKPEGGLEVSEGPLRYVRLRGENKDAPMDKRKKRDWP